MSLLPRVHVSRILGAVPVFALCGTLCFAINWLAFVPAFGAQTERYYDLTGSLTYLGVVATAVVAGSTADRSIDTRAALLAGMVAIWAIRWNRSM